MANQPKKQPNKQPDKQPNDSNSQFQINFLRDVLMNQVGYKNALDSKANILLGVAGVIFGLCITQINPARAPPSQLGFIVVIASTALTCLFCIWMIKTPFQKQKFDQRLMCFTGFGQWGYEQYSNEMKETMMDNGRMVDEYLTEIYGLFKNSIEPKYNLLKISVAVLTIGLVFGSALFILGSV